MKLSPDYPNLFPADFHPLLDFAIRFSDDYTVVEERYYDDWTRMDDLNLFYAPCYAPQFTAKGLEYAKKTAHRRRQR